MVSTPLLLANLKLLSVVNSDSQRTAALLHATHHLWVCVYPHVHTPWGHLCAQINCNVTSITTVPPIPHMIFSKWHKLVWLQFKRFLFVFVCIIRYIGALGARVICDNIPGLVNKQRQLCQRHPDIMQAIGEGTKEWIRECQHQFRHHRWNCSTLDRDHTVFGRVLLRSKSVCVSTYWLCGQRVQILSLNLSPICY